NVQTVVPAVSSEAAAAASTAGATNLGAIRVTGLATDTQVIPIDVSTPEFSNNYSMSVVNQLPTGRGPESVALLSSKVKYDNQTTGLIQMGGASPAETITSTQVLSANAGVSWTSTTGGTIASTVRQGTNRFQAGYSLYFTPATSWFNPH